jgi:hypothetical protein
VKENGKEIPASGDTATVSGDTILIPTPKEAQIKLLLAK